MTPNTVRTESRDYVVLSVGACLRGIGEPER